MSAPFIEVVTSRKIRGPYALDASYQVDSIAARDAIPTGERYEGLQVVVAGGNGVFLLREGLTNSDWLRVDYDLDNTLIFSADTNVLTVTNPSLADSVILTPITNVANGSLKLDGSAQIPDGFMLSERVAFTSTQGLASVEVKSALDELKVITDGLVGGLNYLGVFDPANPPVNPPKDGDTTNYTTGDLYVVSVAGFWNFTTGDQTPDSGSDNVANLQVGDNIIANPGIVWEVIPSVQSVTSVNGKVGAVVLITDDINEGSTNLYYTEARVSANTDVAANTAKVSADGSVGTHSDVDLTGTGEGKILVERTGVYVPEDYIKPQTGSGITVQGDGSVDWGGAIDQNVVITSQGNLPYDYSMTLYGASSQTRFVESWRNNLNGGFYSLEYFNELDSKDYTVYKLFNNYIELLSQNNTGGAPGTQFRGAGILIDTRTENSEVVTMRATDGNNVGSGVTVSVSNGMSVSDGIKGVGFVNAGNYSPPVTNAERWLTPKQYVDDAIAASGTPPAGTIEGAIQLRNAAGTEFETDDQFYWEQSRKSLIGLRGNPPSFTALPYASLILGEDLIISGAGGGTMAWNLVGGSVNEFDNAGTARNFNDSLLIGTGNTVRIANGAFGVFSSILWGESNLIEPGQSGNYVYSNVGGGFNISRNGYQHVTGNNADVAGVGAFVHANGTATEKIRADGSFAGVLCSSNNANQGAGEGANAENSFILASLNGHIPSDAGRTVILGAADIKARSGVINTTYVHNMIVGEGKADDSIMRVPISTGSVTSGEEGLFRYNNSKQNFQGHDGTNWLDFATGANFIVRTLTFTGGTLTLYPDARIHVITLQADVDDIEVTVDGTPGGTAATDYEIIVIFIQDSTGGHNVLNWGAIKTIDGVTPDFSLEPNGESFFNLSNYNNSTYIFGAGNLSVIGS